MSGTTNLALIGDSLEYSLLIREQLDSLNVLIQWIFQDCSHKDTDTLDMKIISERYIETAQLLQFQASNILPFVVRILATQEVTFLQA